MTTLYSGKVVGITFSPAKENVQALQVIMENSDRDDAEVVAKLKAEPQNKFDNRAIAVLAGLRIPGESLESVNFMHVGHIPRTNTEPIHKAGVENVQVSVEQLKEYESKIAGIDIKVTSPG
jgi:hypothetical protein